MLRCTCCGRDGGGRRTQHQSHSGASSGGSLWTCRRYLLRTGSADHPSCCPLNSDPHRQSAPELQLQADSEQTTGEENVTFNHRSCFNAVGMLQTGTHWTKGQVPVQVGAIFQPIKVKLAVQFPCEVKAAALISDGSHVRVWCCCFTTQTVLGVEGVRSLPQGTATRGTAETLPVEVESLCTQPLHHVNSLRTWVTFVSWRWKCPSHRGNLKQHGDN